jgi:hypothetical protein
MAHLWRLYCPDEGRAGASWRRSYTVRPVERARKSLTVWASRDSAGFELRYAVATQARAADYNFETSKPSLADDRTQSTQTQAVRSPIRAVEQSGPLEFLQLLGRAVQQYHTYPATSPMCRNAVEACQRSLVALRRDQILCRVSPTDLIVDEVPLGKGGIVEHELARRLHAAAIAQVTIDQSVSLREIAHFCNDLLASSSRSSDQPGLIEMLTEHGVDQISLRPAYQPEVLQVRPPAAPVAELIDYQRQKREQLFATGGHIEHLYPPDKGWVRVDPSAKFPTVSLTDLAVLANDPAALATMLVRLTDDDGPAAAGDALSEKFTDVATLFSALDPKIARVMFSKLARAVLDLDTERRQALLRRTILPSLLDGRIDGTVLRDFPDVDLAEALCLLLDLETAAPELVTTALSRLELGPEREAAVLPLLERNLQQRGGEAGTDIGLDSHARRLVRIDHDRTRSFAEFAAYDLSLDDDAARTLGEIRDGIVQTDIISNQLDCLLRLTRLEPNPDLVQRFAKRAQPLIDSLERSGRWEHVASWLSRYRQLGEEVRESRPDVTDVIAAQLGELCTAARARKVLELADGDDHGRMLAGQLIEALGPAIGPALLTAMRPAHNGEPGGAAKETRAKGIVQVLCDHAPLVAPALVAALGQGDVATDRIVVRVLGLAGHGYEAALGQQLESNDQQTVREALRSLARIGTPQAAALVSKQVQNRRDWVAAAAEETLWHFPAAEAQREVRALLANREYVVQHPAVAARLLDRVAQHGTQGLESALRLAASLQYRFWNPPQMRLGRKAKALLNR